MHRSYNPRQERASNDPWRALAFGAGIGFQPRLHEAGHAKAVTGMGKTASAENDQISRSGHRSDHLAGRFLRVAARLCTPDGARVACSGHRPTGRWGWSRIRMGALF
jgi:hypothetical protein